MLVAAVAVYDSHVLASPPIPNFYSLHSWIGGLAVTVFVFQVSNLNLRNISLNQSSQSIITFQWIGGFVTFLFPQLKAAQREVIMPYHIFFGMSGFILAIAAALLGLSEKAGLYVHITFTFTHHFLLNICFFSISFGTCSRKLYTLSQEGLIVNMIGVLITVFAILVIYLASHRNYKRQSLPEDAILLTGHDE